MPKTIGQYLLDRLRDYGVGHIFGVPGDYVLRFDKLIEQHEIKFINTTRENTAGYMADAYARLRGMGVACITYGVGINITNALAQSYVEGSPVVIISGAAGNRELLRKQPLHHLINKSSNSHPDTTQLHIFEQLTIAQAVLDNPVEAADEIDRVLELCIQHQSPVYIELPRDSVDALIGAHVIQSLPRPTSDPEALREALDETKEILLKSRNPVLWIGHEIERFKLIEPLLQFAEQFNIPIVSTLLGKTAVNERHPLFVGVYQGDLSRQEVRQFVDTCDCAFILGAIMSDVDTGIFTAKLNQEQKVVATAEALNINHHHYQGVNFSDFIEGLAALPPGKTFKNTFPKNAERRIAPFTAEKGKKMTAGKVFDCIQKYLGPENIVTADIGDALFGSADFILPQNSYLACAYFGTLGFATPGAIGAQIAVPERRVIAIVGDGAFQMTSMELSTAVRYHLDPIVIVLNNHGYGTERPILEGGYNDIVDWNYALIPQVLGGGIGIKAGTEEEFEQALKTAIETRGTFYLIEVVLDKNDYSPAMQRFCKLVGGKG